MHAFKNYYIKCTVTGPITSWYCRSTQSLGGIKIAIIDTSASEDTDRTQGSLTTRPVKSMSKDSEMAKSRMLKTLFGMLLKKYVWAMGCLSFWGLLGPTWRRLFYSKQLPELENKAKTQNQTPKLHVYVFWILTCKLLHTQKLSLWLVNFISYILADFKCLFFNLCSVLSSSNSYYQPTNLLS